MASTMMTIMAAATTMAIVAVMGVAAKNAIAGHWKPRMRGREDKGERERGEERILGRERVGFVGVEGRYLKSFNNKIFMIKFLSLILLLATEQTFSSLILVICNEIFHTKYFHH